MIEAHLAPCICDIIPKVFQKTQRTGGDDIRRIFRLIEAYAYVRLRSEIIDFVWLDFFDNVPEPGAIRYVAVMQEEIGVLMRIGVDSIQPLCVEGGGATHDPVYLILFREQEFRQV